MNAAGKRSRVRRWLRFSLRGLLLLVVVVACLGAWLGAHIRRARQEQRIIAELTAEHGQSLNLIVANPFDADDDGAMPMFFEGGPPWLTKLLGADIFRATTALTCYAPGNSFSSAVDEDGKFFWQRTYLRGVSTEQLGLIAKLSHLNYLQLESNPIDDTGVAQIVKLRRLRTLNLSHTAITDAAVETLAKLRSLRDLNISYTDITDQAIDSLARCKRLERLNIESTQLSGARVEWLQRQLPTCEIIR